MCPLTMHYFSLGCGHTSSEDRPFIGHCQCPLSKPWSVEANGECDQCILGSSQPLSYDPREQAKAEFRLQIMRLEEERRVKGQRWSEYQARREEEQVLCSIPPQSLAFVQAERLLDLYCTLTSDLEFFCITGKGNRRLHLLERAIAQIPPALMKGMRVGSLALQAFVTSTTLVNDSNEYLYDTFMFEPPEEINLPDMERQILAWEQTFAGQIRYLMERLRVNITTELVYTELMSKICDNYFSWRGSWESDGPGAITTRQLEPEPEPFAVLLSIEDLSLHDRRCGICREAYGTSYEKKEAETPVRLRCGHTFGLDCLVSWLKDYETCPLCRRDYSGGPASGDRQGPESSEVNMIQ